MPLEAHCPFHPGADFLSEAACRQEERLMNSKTIYSESTRSRNSPVDYRATDRFLHSKML